MLVPEQLKRLVLPGDDGIFVPGVCHRQFPGPKVEDAELDGHEHVFLVAGEKLFTIIPCAEANHNRFLKELPACRRTSYNTKKIL